MRVDLDLTWPDHLPEEHVAEGSGVPDALDRNAVRAEQVIDGRPLLVGALELRARPRTRRYRERAGRSW